MSGVRGEGRLSVMRASVANLLRALAGRTSLVSFAVLISLASVLVTLALHDIDVLTRVPGWNYGGALVVSGALFAVVNFIVARTAERQSRGDGGVYAVTLALLYGTYIYLLSTPPVSMRPATLEDRVFIAVLNALWSLPALGGLFGWWRGLRSGRERTREEKTD